LTHDDEFALAQAWLKRHGYALADAQVADPARLVATVSTTAGRAAARLPFGTEPSIFTAILESLAGEDRRDG
jgi:hypothetical protein